MVLTGAVLGVESDVMDKFAGLVVGARVGQSVTHIASGRNLAINVRFGFFALQIISLIVMMLVIAGSA